MFTALKRTRIISDICMDSLRVDQQVYADTSTGRMRRLSAVIIVVAGFAALFFASRFASVETERNRISDAQLETAHPLFMSSTEAAAQPWLRNAYRQIEYRKRWYQCLGQGEVTVFIWTVWIFV
jgi:hypothetical protein